MSIKQIYHLTALTGGINSTYLDYADGNSLSDKDRAFVINSGIFYIYELNATSGAAESVPTVISPDTNAGTKRWILIAIMADLTSVGGVFGKVTLTQPATGSTLTIADGKTLTCTQDTTLDEAVAMSSKAPKASPVFTTQITAPVVYGGSAANDDITIEGTSHGTKTTSYVILQPTTGNVGIGTTGPTAQLMLGGAQTAAQTFGIARGATFNSYYLSSGSYNQYLDIGVSADDQKSIIRFLTQTVALTNPAERMRIDSTGNVGIGTTNPLVKFSVVDSVSTATTELGQFFQPALASGNFSYLSFGRSTGAGEGGALEYVYNSTTANSYIALVNYGDTAATGLVIKKAGNVGIGTTDLDGTPAVGKLTVKGTTNDGSTLIFVGRDSDEANVITIDTDGDILNSAGVYGMISDEKLKKVESIRDATSKLSDILNLKVRNFELKDNNLKLLGFIAQEFETVFPGLIKSTPDMERVPDPDWKPKILKRQVMTIVSVEKSKTEIVEEGGKYIHKTTTEIVEDRQGQFEDVPLYGMNGEQLFTVTLGTPAVMDKEGNEIEAAGEATSTPILHRIPLMEEYTEDESVRPTIIRPTGTVTKAIKQSVLIPILVKAVQELSARVETLELKLA